MPVTDVVIVGAGPVGAALALLLRASGLTTTLLEARPGAAADARTLALSFGSRMILEQAGAWNDALRATPIDAIHVSHKGSFGRTLLTAADGGVPALGYVLSYSDLQRELDARLDEAGIPVLRGAKVEAIAFEADRAAVAVTMQDAPRTVAARLVVLADGGANVDKVPGVAIVEKDYRQSALVAAVTTDTPSAGVAYERFTPLGPAALLPIGDRYSLVWTGTPEEVARLLQLGDVQFLAQLNDHFGTRAGRFTGVARRASFPLRLRYAKPRVAPRAAIIGAAAQALHPVAGQGLNLGIRDAADLAKVLSAHAGADVGALAVLTDFADERKADARINIGFTDSLVRMFSTDHPVLRAGRGLGLALLDIAPPARRLLARKMIFGA